MNRHQRDQIPRGRHSCLPRPTGSRRICFQPVRTAHESSEQAQEHLRTGWKPILQLPLRRILSFCSLVCLSLLGVSCGRGVAKPEEDKPAPVKWEGMRQVILEEWTELVGTTQPLPDHAARITAPIGGVVLTVLPARSGGQTAGDKSPIAEGQPVEKGEILAQLDPTAIEANLAKAQAAKKVLQAEREVAETTVRQASLELKSLQELAKEKTSGDRQLVSPIMLERAGLAVESAKATLRANDRKLEGADKDEKALELEIQLFTLKAPRKGRLGRIQVVIGQTLPLGAPVAELVDIEEEIDVLCFVPPSEARKLQLGQPAHVGLLDKSTSVETMAGPEGKVVYIANQAEAETGLFAVKVRFPNSELRLRASSVARVQILTSPGKACWAVPEAALLEDQDPPGIVVVEKVVTKKNADGKEEQTGKAVRLQAKTGIRDRSKNQVEILRLEDPAKKWHGALEETDVVVEKGQSLQTGDAVKFEEEEEEEEKKPEEKP
jgi:RND family efflux transporter MFP subunit